MAKSLTGPGLSSDQREIVDRERCVKTGKTVDQNGRHEWMQGGEASRNEQRDFTCKSENMMCILLHDEVL